jgi:hypothetical protein
MPNLPSLQSGSTVQYPFVTSLRYSTGIIRFVDGSEQRFSHTRGVHRTWTVGLRDLNPSEIEAVAAFATSSDKQAFTFYDPVTGEVHSQCTLLAQPVTVEHADEQRAHLSLTIVEVE